MSRAKSRDWSVTVYPCSYKDSTPEEIEDKEAEWLSDKEKGPFRAQESLIYLFGCMERGHKNHKLHCHYRAHFKNAVRLQTIHEVFGSYNKSYHMADALSWTLYIKKEGKFEEAPDKITHVAGPFEDGEMPPPSRQIMWQEVRTMVKAGARDNDIFEAFPFAANCASAIRNMRAALPQVIPEQFWLDCPYMAYQQRVLDMCAEPIQVRRWIWVWSTEYHTGKSQLCVELQRIGPGLVFSYKDPRSGLYLFEPNYHKIICFDIPRGVKLTDALMNEWESISDGTMQVSDKFYPVVKRIYAHLVIFSNHHPPLRYKDRIVEVLAKKGCD
nr:MAG: replication associated protein [Cressdnaviricota sp.]